MPTRIDLSNPRTDSHHVSDIHLHRATSRLSLTWDNRLARTGAHEILLRHRAHRRGLEPRSAPPGAVSEARASRSLVAESVLGGVDDDATGGSSPDGYEADQVTWKFLFVASNRDGVDFIP